MHILSTKLNRPAINRQWVPRPRLISALDSAAQKRVTLISAPAGYGKTTLVAQWLDHNATPSAWLALDRHDGDLDRFLRYLITSVRRAVPEFGTELEELCTAAVLPSPDYLAESLIGELAALNHPLVIVLDDFHSFDSEAVLALLRRLVEFQPPSLHLIISTRVDPPLPFATWRVRDWAAEIRAAELRFFKSEAQAFFAPFFEPRLSGDTVEMIFNRTEGWAAGMQLARISLAAADNQESFASSFSGNDRMIADFLIDEVVSRQTPEIREFLAVTSLLERFCAPLGDHLLESRIDAAESLELISKLEQENLFIVPLDSERLWYRYHHLFRALLKNYLKAELTEGQKTQILERAGQWFAGQGLIDEALHYFLAVSDIDRAAELIEINLDGMLEVGFSRRALWRLLDRFPASAFKQQPVLALALAHSKVFRWDRHGINELLDSAEAALNDPDSAIPEHRRHNLLADSHAQRGFHLFWSQNPHEALEHTLRALQYLSDAHPYRHFFAAQYAALGYAMTGARDKALKLLDQEIASAYSSGSPYLSAFLFVQVGINYYAGNLNVAEQISKKIFASQSTQAVHRYWSLHTRWLVGCVAYERNQLDAAKQHFQSVEQNCYQLSVRIYHDSLVGLALVALAGKDLDRALGYADTARKFALECKDPFSIAISESFDARLAPASSETPTARSPQAPQAVDGNMIFMETPALTHAEGLLAKDDPADLEAGLDFVQKAVSELRRQYNTRQLIQFMAVQAVALHRTGRQDEALAALEEALAMARPLGFVRSFVDRGPAMAELLRLYPGDKPAAPYARRLLEAFGATGVHAPAEPARGKSPDGRTAGSSKVVLSRREREILDLLDTSLASKEIAGRLFISPETVKRHLYNIYRKLKVHSRLQAIAEAKKQGLLREK